MNTPPAHLVASFFFASILMPGMLPAQVPPESVLVATSVTTPNTSLVAVDKNGAGTVITGHNRGTHQSVALDPSDPAAVWGLGAWPTIGSAPVGHYILSGSNVQSNGLGDGVVGSFGRVNRCHVYGDQLLITFGSVTPGLYARSLNGGSAKLVYNIPDAYDITVLRDRVYVTTWNPTIQASQLYWVDMSTTPATGGLVPIATSSGPTPIVFKAIGTMGWPELATFLIIGDSNGKLWFVDPSLTVGNTFTVTFGPSRGMAEAIMTHPDQAIGVCIATAKELYSQTSYNTGGNPFYVSSDPIRDISVLGGSSQTYGTECAGAGGAPTHGHGLNGWPFHGNTQFTLEMENGPATTPGALIVGLSDQTYGGAPLPLDLSLIGATGCFLNASIDLRVAVTTDVGGAVSLPAPIPSSSQLVGAEIFTQWGVFELGVNAAGLTTSKGLKLTLR